MNINLQDESDEIDFGNDPFEVLRFVIPSDAPFRNRNQYEDQRRDQLHQHEYERGHSVAR